MATAVGRRILSEIDETSLDQILTSLRVDLHQNPPNTSIRPSRRRTFPIPPLHETVSRYFRATQLPGLSVSGRQLPLLYKLLATLIAAPHQNTVLVVDLEGRFDITRVLECRPHLELVDSHESLGEESAVGSDTVAHGTVLHVEGTSASHTRAEDSVVTMSDLSHIHVVRPARGSRTHLADVISSAHHYMLYGIHGSQTREWWGTMLIGGGGQDADADVTASWKGWLRVDREDIRGFAFGTSAEEALAERERRQTAVDETHWVGSSPWGGLAFSEGWKR